jgi:hypothetical protein
LAAAGRLLVGLGVSVTFIALLKLNAAWFSERKFGTLTGLTILLGNLGAVLAASPLAWALAYVSWRDAFVVVGMLSLFLAWLAWWLVRDNPAQVGLPSLRELEGKTAHPAHEGHWYDGLVEVAGNRHLARLLRQPGHFRHPVRLRRPLGRALPHPGPRLGPGHRHRPHLPAAGSLRRGRLLHRHPVGPSGPAQAGGPAVLRPLRGHLAAPGPGLEPANRAGAMPCSCSWAWAPPASP